MCVYTVKSGNVVTNPDYEDRVGHHQVFVTTFLLYQPLQSAAQILKNPTPQ